jgi:hypothetical protein
MAILTLSCGDALTPESAYFVSVHSRTNITNHDLPPWHGMTLTGFTMLDGGMGNWFNPSDNKPDQNSGIWNINTTYSIGDTVASAHYGVMIDTLIDGSLKNVYLVYRSLVNGNTGNDPENFTGQWTCITNPPAVSNRSYSTRPWGYKLASIPTNAELAAATWVGGMGHSLFWLATDIATHTDRVNFSDVYVRVNFRTGSGILVVGYSRPVWIPPLTAGAQGQILNPGITAEIQCWTSSGLSNAPLMTLGNFSPVIPEGTAANGNVGVFYTNALVASGGTPPYTYSLVSGSFPSGVTLNSSTGVISGIPTNSGSFSFTAQVVDSAAGTASVTCGMVIIPAPIIVPPPLSQFELYEMQTPEDVETLPVPKKYDQLGPTRFDKIGKIFGFRVRLIVTGNTRTMPFKIYGDDSESLPNLNSPFFTGEFPVVPNIDKVYEIQLPKSVNTDVFRLSLGPVEDPFHRYDVLIKVHTSGLPGQARWIPVK